MAEKTYRHHETTWQDLQNAGSSDIEALRRQHPTFLELDVAEILKVGQRPHLEQRSDYVFLVLLFPVYNRATRGIEPAEVDFFLTEHELITVHDGRLTPMQEALTEMDRHSPSLETAMGQGPQLLLLALLERLLSYCNPMLDHISLDIHAIDEQIFKGSQRQTVREILITRRNITDVRKIMQAHKNTLKKFLDVVLKDGNGQTQVLKVTLESLITRTKEIWDHLESFKESIIDLHATNESLLSNSLNDIMKNYTTMSVVIFSMTLVATTFGLGARSTPLIEHPGAFWFISGLLVLVALGMVEYFKKRKWL